MSANEQQVGGDHYKSEYQHWDFVIDTGLHYLLGCATKYISRHEKKNGAEDLKKAIHYINKAQEMDIYVAQSSKHKQMLDEFVGSNDIGNGTWDHDALICIFKNDYQGARNQIEYIISKCYSVTGEKL